MGDPADALLRRAAAGAPANIALMHLLIEAGHPDEARDALRRAREWASATGDEGPARRLGEVCALWRAVPGAWELVRAVIAEVDHAAPPGADAVAAIAAGFDAAARVSPEAGAALYALGDHGLLDRATGEVVAWLGARGLLGELKRVLDLGCGGGRFSAALAGRVGEVTGIDVSAGMVAAARRRVASLPNVRIVQVAGRDLAVFAEGAFDLVLAVDSFPYLVQAGGDLARVHVREAARVLAPGGSLVILNYAYRGDPDGDRAEVAAHAAASGLVVVEAGARPFRLWDGLAFHLRKPS